MVVHVPRPRSAARPRAIDTHGRLRCPPSTRDTSPVGESPVLLPDTCLPVLETDRETQERLCYSTFIKRRQARLRHRCRRGLRGQRVRGRADASTPADGFPATGNAYRTTCAGGNDLFVVRFSPTGVLLYCTYFGMSGSETFYTTAVTRPAPTPTARRASPARPRPREEVATYLATRRWWARSGTSRPRGTTSEPCAAPPPGSIPVGHRFQVKLSPGHASNLAEIAVRFQLVSNASGLGQEDTLAFLGAYLEDVDRPLPSGVPGDDERIGGVAQEVKSSPVKEKGERVTSMGSAVDFDPDLRPRPPHEVEVVHEDQGRAGGAEAAPPVGARNANGRRDWASVSRRCFPERPGHDQGTDSHGRRREAL